MYQESTKIKFPMENPEESFNRLIAEFLKYVKMSESDFKSDSSEYDLSKRYDILWACLWNDRNRVGTTGFIVQKNDKFALILFPDNKMSLDRIYRLEDIKVSPVNPK